ncbi:MAG: hypothetical protein NTY19_10145, partial [Planctomycetota bacterium]|nr:hypothetical protein [Planctomycetota bacterium]
AGISGDLVVPGLLGYRITHLWCGRSDDRQQAPPTIGTNHRQPPAFAANGGQPDSPGRSPGKGADPDHVP